MTTFVRTQEVEHDIGAAGELSLRVTVPDVELRAVTGAAARVVVTFEIRAGSDAEADEAFERVRYRVDARDGSLAVSEPKVEGGIGALARMFLGEGSVTDVRVDVTAPPGCSLVVEGVSGDLTSIGFVGSQRYRLVSGDLVLDQVGGDIRVKGVSSDVSLRAADALRQLELETVSGDASVVAPEIGRLAAATVSGDLELEAVLGTDAEHRIETVSGDLSLGSVGDLQLEVRGLSSDVDVRFPHRITGARDRRRYQIGEGGPTVVFSTMSGDVEVRSPRRLDVRTPPAPPAPPAPPQAPDTASPDPTAPPPAADLEVLRALERGEIDVDEAARRLGGPR